MSRGVVVWLCGLPACGKSALARDVAAAISSRPCVVLDGDDVRAALVPSPGYDPESRAAFYRSLANLAAMLAEQGLVVLVPATANRAQFRAYARSRAPTFIEVYVDTPLEECRRRDPKGLYARADARNGGSMPGVEERFESPQTPDLIVHDGTSQDAVHAVIAAIS